MKSTRWNTLMGAALLSLVALTACVEDSPGDSEPAICGAGDMITISANNFCVYSQSVVVEEGFRCPEQLPHQHSYNELAICSGSEQSPGNGELMELYETWGELHNDTGNSNGTPSNGATSNGTTPDLATLCSDFCVQIDQCELLSEFESADVAECVAQCQTSINAGMAGLTASVLPCATTALASGCDLDNVEACFNELPQETIRACIDDNPGEACPGVPPVPTCASVINECLLSGVDDSCSPLITREAAFCIAAAAGLAEGLEPWTRDLVYNVRYARPIWSVQNLLASSEEGSREGNSIDVDAVTGQVLGRGGWAAMP